MEKKVEMTLPEEKQQNGFSRLRGCWGHPYHAILHG
jgi:hypothetical protein